MEIYFVRHGETDLNRRHIHQSDQTPLNELGQRQAEVVAKVIANFKPTHLLTSPLARTVQTAKIITRTIGLKAVFMDSVVELVRPQGVIGFSHYGFKSLWFVFNWFFNKNPSYWQKTGGESRDSFFRRINQAKDELEALPKDAVVIVVSHSIFINFFVAYICNEKPLSVFKASLRLLKVKRLNNSSLVHIHFDSETKSNTCPWTLVTFDDDAHVVT
jgi:broad specificity phosphatase PhoE